MSASNEIEEKVAKLRAERERRFEEYKAEIRKYVPQRAHKNLHFEKNGSRMRPFSCYFKYLNLPPLGISIKTEFLFWKRARYYTFLREFTSIEQGIEYMEKFRHEN